MSCRK